MIPAQGLFIPSYKILFILIIRKSPSTQLFSSVGLELNRHRSSSICSLYLCLPVLPLQLLKAQPIPMLPPPSSPFTVSTCSLVYLLSPESQAIQTPSFLDAFPQAIVVYCGAVLTFYFFSLWF